MTARDGVELAYRLLGQGREVVLLPGAAHDEDLAPLTGVDRQLLFYDARNRGRSDPVTEPARLGFHQEVDDLDAVRAAFGVESCAVVAWSYMAGVAAYHALLNPARVTRLVLVSPIPPCSETAMVPTPSPAPHLLARLDQLQAEGLARRDPAAYCREWRRVHVPVLMGDPRAFERLQGDPCACPNEWPGHVATALAHVFLDLGHYDWRDLLRTLDVPTLVVHGELDQIPIEAVRPWAELLPFAELVEMPGVGHFPWAEAPDAFFGLVDAFLRG